MPYKFRNPGPWGAGSLEDLDSIDVDNNFWQAILDIAAKASQGVGIDNIIVSGSQFTVVLTNHALLGPYQLPAIQLIFKGEWIPNYAYLGGSIITHGGTTYFIPVNHVSEATFDPGANDGHGQNFYEVLLQNPAATIPSGGAVGAFLRKAGIGDYVSAWATALLEDLSNIVITAPATDDVLAYTSGHWHNKALVAPINSLAGLTDVLQSPSPSSGNLVYWNGSLFAYLPQSSLSVGFTQITGTPTAVQTRPTTVTTLGTTGTVSLDPTLGDVFKVTPSGNITLNAASAPAGARITLAITTSGTSSFNVTPNTNFISAGALATGTVSGKRFTITFIGDGTNFFETGRTAAM